MSSMAPIYTYSQFFVLVEVPFLRCVNIFNVFHICHAVLRVKRVRDKYESELKELERSERVAVEKQQELRRRQMEMEEELIGVQALLRQKEQEVEDVTQVRSTSLAFAHFEDCFRILHQCLPVGPGTRLQTLSFLLREKG